MIPDLGKYAATVLSSYGASLVLLALLVAVTLWRVRKVRADMAELENRLKTKANRDG